MTVLALDLSLTSTGVAHSGGTSCIKSKKRGAERLVEIREKIRTLILIHAPDLVVIEGYAYARANQAHQVGELGGVVRVLLYDMGIEYALVAPTALKKWATGKGNADKDTMLETAIRKHGFTGHGNDEADAWLLFKMAESGALCASKGDTCD